MEKVIGEAYQETLWSHVHLLKSQATPKSISSGLVHGTRRRKGLTYVILFLQILELLVALAYNLSVDNVYFYFMLFGS